MVQLNNGKIVYDLSQTNTIRSNNNMLTPEEIDNAYALIVDKNEQELLNFYEPLMNKSHYEAIMTQMLHIELLLRKLIAKKYQLNLNDFADNSLFDLINIVYLERLMYEDQAKELHELRNIRNKLAHEFLTHITFTFNEIIDLQGKLLVKIMEINDRLNKLK